MRKILRIFGVFILFAVFAYVLLIGLNACGCIGGSSEAKTPGFDKAKYALVFQTTGQRVYIDEVSVTPSAEPGKKIYTPVSGYWELKKNTYAFIDRPVPFDEAVFGPIELRRNDD